MNSPKVITTGSHALLLSLLNIFSALRSLGLRADAGAGKKVVKETRDKAVDILIKRATKKAARRAAGAGAVMSGVWQNAGETYGELYNSAATQGDRIRASLVAGSIAGALDAAIPLIVLKRVFPTNVASKLSDKALKRTAIETLGENLDKAFKGYTPLKRKFFLTLAKDTSNEAWTEFKTSPTPEDYQKILSVVGERELLHTAVERIH